MALTAAALYARVRGMLPEMIKFGIVGGIGTVIDLGGAGLLQGNHVEPLAAKAISVSVATVFTYAGSRFWTFKERENQAVHREAVLFFGLNIVGLVIAEAVISLVTYAMGLQGGLAYNAASFVGTGFGTIFRFWAYRRWVFLEPEQQSAEPLPPPNAAAHFDYPPWELDPNFLGPTESPLAAEAPQAAPAPQAGQSHGRTNLAPWHQEPGSAWDPAHAPTMSWSAPSLEDMTVTAPQPAPVLDYGFSAPDLRDLPTPPVDTHSAIPDIFSPAAPPAMPTAPLAAVPVRPAARPPRSSGGGGRHRKH